MAKNILIGFITGLLLIVTLIYILVPKNITVSSQIIAQGSTGSIHRVLAESTYRNKWFPRDGKLISPTTYELDGCTYHFGIDNSFNNNVLVGYKNIQANTLLTVVATADSLLISWRFSKESGYNPINRLTDYFTLKHLKETNEKVLASLGNFMKSRKNVYGFNVAQKTQQDSTLITIKKTLPGYPSVENIYADINRLKDYAAANGAVTTNAPMLNIENNGTGGWNYMVALPITRDIGNKGDIIAKRMFAGGKILITDEISGSFTTIDKALQELEKFKTDYGYMSPAIPFQSLITDRYKEKDSAKWQTRLYYPVY